MMSNQSSHCNNCVNTCGESMSYNDKIAFVFGVYLIIPFAGCSQRRSENMNSSPNTDKYYLSKLCLVPDYMEHVEWQHFETEYRNDWSLLIRGKVSEQGKKELDKTLVRLDGIHTVFVGAPSIPDWLGKDKGIFHVESSNRYTVETIVYEPNPFTKSPLLHGFVIRLDDNTIIIGLHTR